MSQATAERAADRMPTWLIGDWTPVVRDWVDVMRAAVLVGAIGFAFAGELANAVRLLITFFVMLVPRFLDVPRPFDFAFVLGMSLQAWGNGFGWFNSWGSYNKVVHFLLPLGVAPLLYLVLIRL